MTVAALYVERRGPYFGMPDVDPWDKERDARLYAGPHPVVAHPPCERWGRYWSGGPSARARRRLGDDDGCFAMAVHAVRTWGGVLEHPEASHAFRIFHLGSPDHRGEWARSDDRLGWVCCVEQGHYGHAARKKTWLYACGLDAYDRPGAFTLPRLIWGPSSGRRLDEGFHSKTERDAARASGVRPRVRLSSVENALTPPTFADILIGIARSVADKRAA